MKYLPITKRKDDVLAQSVACLMTMSVSEIMHCWMVGRLMDNDCNVGLFQSIILEFIWRAWQKLWNTSIRVFHMSWLTFKPSTSKKVTSITPWANLYGTVLENKNCRTRAGWRRRAVMQKPVRIVSCPGVKLCILWTWSTATCVRWSVCTVSSYTELPSATGNTMPLLMSV
jgi:hypothetical protein